MPAKTTPGIVGDWVKAHSPGGGPPRRGLITVRIVRPVLALFVATLLVAPSAWGALGQPDPGFGTQGYLRIPAGAETAHGATFAAVAVREGGAIVAAGQARQDDGDSDPLVAQVTADGRLDPTFNEAGARPGLQRVAMGPGSSGALTSAAIGPAGRVVVAGEGEQGGRRGFLVLRLDAGGRLDESFAADGPRPGVLVQPLPTRDRAIAESVVALPDGRITVAGRVIDAGGATRPFVARVTADGTGLDPMFARGAGHLVGLLGSWEVGGVTALAAVPGTRHLLAGGFASAARHGITARLDEGGRVLWLTQTRPDVGGFADLEVRPDGSFYGLGRLVARFTAAGMPDAGFGSGHPPGTARPDDPRLPSYEAIAVDTTGQPLLAGSWSTMTRAFGIVTLLDERGEPDATFNAGDGTGSTSIFPGAPHSALSDVTLAPGGAPVAVGQASTNQGGVSPPPGSLEPLVVKLQVDAPPTAMFGLSRTPVAGQAVDLDARGSSDPEGALERYLWDLDGDGAYETDAGAAAVLTHVFPATGELTVGLKVVDRRGNAATATSRITVSQAPLTQPPQPRASRVLLHRLSGRVLLRRPGARRFRVLRGDAVTASGTEVDARHGRVRIITERPDRSAERAIASGGRFIVRLGPRGSSPSLNLSGSRRRGCRDTALVRRLWVRSWTGFRTRGRYAAATVKGRWLTADRCDGTLIRVLRGAGKVSALRRGSAPAARLERGDARLVRRRR